MVEEDEVYKVGKDYLNTLLQKNRNSLAGKVCARIEYIKDPETLKKEVKNLIHEAGRDLKNTIEAYGKGSKLILVNFKSHSE